MWLQTGSKFVGRSVAAGGGGPVGGTANFNATFLAPDGTTLTDFDAHFVNNHGSFAITSNKLYAAASGEISLAHYNDTIVADQYAYASIRDAGAAGAIGVAVRCAAGATRTGYGFYVDATTRYLAKWIAGVFTLIASEVASAVDGDDISLEVIGTTLRPLINGVLWGPGAKTDGSIASGFAGIVGRNDGGVSNWAINAWGGSDMW